MYEELIKRLRDAAKMSEALAVLLPNSGGNATAKLYNEAADAIEELSDIASTTATIIENEQDMRVIADKPHWISVTEKLPEKQEPVLVYTKAFINRDDEEIFPYVGMAYYTYSPRGGWWGGTDGNVYGAIGIVEVTHWMPLPPPPKETI